MGVDEVSAELQRAQRMEPVVVVGIDNAGRRGRAREYLPYPDAFLSPPEPDPQGQLYDEFLADEVIPFIEQRFRVERIREGRALGGSSYGALVAAHIAIARPDLFSKLLLESPSFYVDDGHVLRDAAARLNLDRVYLGVGTNELALPDCPEHPGNTEAVDGVRRMAAVLSSASLTEGERLKVVIEECAMHNEAAWANRLPAALEFLIRPCPPVDAARRMSPARGARQDPPLQAMKGSARLPAPCVVAYISFPDALPPSAPERPSCSAAICDGGRWSSLCLGSQHLREAQMSDLFVDTWGTGAPVVLVHGSLATGAEEWQLQRPLADEGFRLLVPDRRGHGQSPFAEGEDYLRDAEDIVELMGDGAHLVGHSYGGLGVLFAAARRPDATLSLALLEPAAFALDQHDPAARALVDEVRALWDQDLPDGDWLIRFLRAVGSDPDALPPELIAAAVPLVPVCRHGRPGWHSELPLAELAAAPFPKVVVSGGHSAGFDAICDGLADRIGASRAVAAGAGHEVQFAEPQINELLLALWRGTNPR